MTLSTVAADARTPSISLTSGQLERRHRSGVVVGALALALLSWVPGAHVNWARGVIVGALAYLALTYFVSRSVEGARRALDRLATGVVTAAFALVLLPLVSLVWTVVQRGVARFDPTFFSDTMRGVVGDGGGAYHAIIGTLIITGVSALLAIPIGVLTAIYLVEYEGGKLRSMITTMVDVMTGIPSIVAGLFAYAFFVLLFGPGTRSGAAGAVALAVLMTPVVVRSSEEMLRLVPQELRQASLALGVPKWLTIVKVVLPTAAAGILTGAALAVARVIGETAPLLITAGLAQGTNKNPFDGRMTTLPVYSYYSYTQPGLPPSAGQDRAWTAALTLIVIVAILFSTSRIIAARIRPEGLR